MRQWVLVYTYLSDEPEGFECPEGWESVEEERVRVRNPVALEVAHFLQKLNYLFI